MITKLLAFFLIIQICNFLISCSSSDDNIVNANSKDNLLPNPSFEKNGLPSLEGWTPDYQDTSLIHFSSDVPPGGGQYSIMINVVWGPPYSINSTVNAEAGTNIYSFSCMAKAFGVGGAINLLFIKSDSLIIRKTIAVTDSIWKQYSLTDTISSSDNDSIRISLTGGFSQLLPGFTFYDNCSLIKE